jgi:hypothetical protein
LKQQQKKKKQQLQEAAVATADAVKQAVLQQQVELIEADEAQEEKIMEKLRRIGRCPAGQRTMHFPQALLHFLWCAHFVTRFTQGLFGTRWRVDTDAKGAATS